MTIDDWQNGTNFLLNTELTKSNNRWRRNQAVPVNKTERTYIGWL